MLDSLEVLGVRFIAIQASWAAESGDWPGPSPVCGFIRRSTYSEYHLRERGRPFLWQLHFQRVAGAYGWGQSWNPT